MRKWRPWNRCLYVIPEVHGNIDSLKIILNRILPLRFSNDEHDKVIMLGDFIDKGENSREVIELILNCKKEYGDNFLCIKGNHEQIMLNAFKSEDNYNYWLSQGGANTINSFLENEKFCNKETYLPFYRLKDIIPDYHIDFLNSLPHYLEIDNYILFHGGINLMDPSLTEHNTYIYDSGSSFKIKKAINLQEPIEINSDKILVGAHNYKDKLPFIYKKYFMLGGSAPKNLILFELNSMICAMIKNGKSKIYRHNFKYFE